MKHSLVIVESPAKARTISGFLGEGYMVESSIGHIRDLPRSAADVPAAHKKKPWARLGVDVDNDFAPLYVIDADKKSHIKHLKDLLESADELLLATDEDREGESIAWHLLEVLKPKVPVKRMVFHEITKKAIQAALDETRELNRELVDAQEARRILDRLYGYEVSPVLWKKVMPRLSAGRVQSVATRIVVERERARMAFRRATWWGMAGQFAADGVPLDTQLSLLDGKRLATGKDFDSLGQIKGADLARPDEASIRALAQALEGRPARVESVEKKPYKRSPAAPFMTSTLQQEAGRKLRFAAKRAMRAAQRLYEGGFITYMRTDSTTLSDGAVQAARRLIADEYGADYLPAQPRRYTKKVKNAQEAHEAIRPAGDSFQHPSEVARRMPVDEARLYELIWKRTVACQMADAKGETLSVKIQARTDEGVTATFSVTGNTITFPGFFRAYVEGSDDPTQALADREKQLPPLREGQALEGVSFTPEDHETQPPARFTEASLVSRLEELGVGRPSTYASILSTIQERGYVWKKGSALVPSWKAFAVVRLLEQHFDKLVDYAFTAKMEDDLDQIAAGTAQTVPWLKRFYFGQPDSPGSTGDKGLQGLVSEQLGEIDARAINTIALGEDSEGRAIAVRVGRYGPYLERGEETAPIPEDLPPDELSVEKAIELLDAPSGDRTIGVDPETSLTVYLRNGRFGNYVQLGEQEKNSKDKPLRASLLSHMAPETLTLEDALKLLSLPRVVGVAADGEEVTAQNGRYGPYLIKGKENRSLGSEEQLFTITLEEALVVLAQPKRRRGETKAEPLKTLGLDGVSGKEITLRKGRFGPYVTDGETNASLRTGDDQETITPERAQELLQIRRDRGPVKKKTRQVAAKQATKKKKTAKKASKKATKAKPAKQATKKKAAIKAEPSASS